MSPCVDDFVVPLTKRDLPGGVRALKSLDARTGLIENNALFVRNLEILDADGHTTKRRRTEAEFLEPFEKLHRLRETTLPIGLEDERRKCPLPHNVVLEPNGA